MQTLLVILTAFLLAPGSAVGAKTTGNDAADQGLLFAAREGRMDLVEYALSQGADIETRESTPARYSALVLATRGGHTRIIRKLLEHGADPNAGISGNLTALMFAVRNDDTGAIELLLKHGADPHASEVHYGNTALHMAAALGNVNSLSYLIGHGADPNIASGRDGRTPMMLAARQEYGLYAVSELIARGADVNRAAKDGSTALMNASIRGHADIVATLIVNHADVNLASRDGRTALHRAAMTGRLEIAEQLLDAGAQVDNHSRDGDTPLALAVYFGQRPVVERLIAAGADTNARGRRQETPLMLAVRGNHPNIMQLLLANGANPNIVADEDGTTALILAAERGLADAVRVLLAAGADAGHRTRAGRTALAAAEEIGASQTAVLLRDADHTPKRRLE